jgi:hypothetical protein
MQIQVQWSAAELLVDELRDVVVQVLVGQRDLPHANGSPLRTFGHLAAIEGGRFAIR